jgi:hypothetical protein
MEIGRNDICFCGSGEKYKKCCLVKNQSRLDSRAVLSSVMKTAHEKILEYTTRRWGQEILLDALEEFATTECGLEISFEEGPDADELSLFMTWFMFLYSPSGIEKSDYDELDQLWLNSETDYYNPTVAQQALKYEPLRFSEQEKDYITQELSGWYCFLQITSHDPVANTTHAKNLCSRNNVSFVSSPIMPRITAGEIVFGKIITFEGEQFLQPMGDVIFKPAVYSEIVPSASEIYAELSAPRSLEDRVAVSSSLLWHYGMLRS